jgi:hypothetical protein
MTGFESARSYLRFEGCGLWAKCGNRGQRPQLQWRLCRLAGGFGCGMRVFSVAGGVDPGAARCDKRPRIRPWRRALLRTSLRTFFRRRPDVQERPTRRRRSRGDSQGWHPGWYVMPLQGMEWEPRWWHGMGNPVFEWRQRSLAHSMGHDAGRRGGRRAPLGPLAGQPQGEDEAMQLRAGG